MIFCRVIFYLGFRFILSLLGSEFVGSTLPLHIVGHYVGVVSCYRSVGPATVHRPSCTVAAIHARHTPATRWIVGMHP